jgi:hypothetical protein
VAVATMAVEVVAVVMRPLAAVVVVDITADK